MSSRDLTPEERRAWRRVTRSVRAIVAAPPPAPPMPDIDSPPSPRPGPKGQEAKAGKPASGLPRSTSRSPSRGGPAPSSGPADRKSERRVRRGQVSFAARFDLHGHTQASADRALRGFLSAQRAQGARCVLVITGKGRQGEGVLRRNFLHWLESADGRALVTGFAEAHPRHGGSGAFYVFLRRSEP